MKKEVSVYNTAVMNYSPPTQSDYAPALPDPHFSWDAKNETNKSPAEVPVNENINHANSLV